ncbi:MAG: hypothetical protein ACK5F0_02260 [Flavobacteriales bacterium]
MRFSIFSVFLIVCGILRLKTTVSGRVSGAWTAANSSYLVTNNIGHTSSAK